MICKFCSVFVNKRYKLAKKNWIIKHPNVRSNSRFLKKWKGKWEKSVISLFLKGKRTVYISTCVLGGKEH